MVPAVGCAQAESSASASLLADGPTPEGQRCRRQALALMCAPTTVNQLPSSVGWLVRSMGNRNGIPLLIKPVTRCQSREAQRLGGQSCWIRKNGKRLRVVRELSWKRLVQGQPCRFNKDRIGYSVILMRKRRHCQSAGGRQSLSDE